jgi:quercetin dioxygenase-like cupin family protein
MPVIKNAAAPEIKWRNGYRVFSLSGNEQGVTCSCSRAVIEPGAGAPLHVHADADEVLIVVEGTLEFRIGTTRSVVGPDHTISIPAGTPHGFVAVGPSPARIFTFFPRIGAFLRTTYLEGEPPAGAALR